jgi:pyruvate/2-oxoglutarate dehydrogenase complex dihydrolipoamide acyltransferase (E2) component
MAIGMAAAMLAAWQPVTVSDYVITLRQKNPPWTTSIMTSGILPPPSPTDSDPRNASRESDDEDADTASQLSIPLSSPPRSRRNSTASHDPRESFVSSGSSNRSVRDDVSRHLVDTPQTSVSPTSTFDAPKEFRSPTYPPSPPRDDTMSISSFASTSSRKARPESLIIAPTNDPLVLGVALVDFNHLVRFYSSIFDHPLYIRPSGWS